MLRTRCVPQILAALLPLLVARRTDTIVSCRSKGMRAGMAGGDGTRG